MKYIDAEDLQVIIEKRINNIESCPFIEAEFGAEMRREGKILAYNDILTLIDSLQREQPSDDLEEAARNVYESWMGGTMDDVRRDMVELGKVLNVRKEEGK